MRAVVAVFGIVWALVNLAAAYVMVSGAFVAKTAIKEGILSQAALLFGGMAIEALAIALVWQCARMLRRA